jgi:hypothetical protein
LIIELIGPKAVGKSTLGPLVASRLGVPHYFGYGFRSLDGDRLTRRQHQSDLLKAVASHPHLFVRALRARRGAVRPRLAFALNTCRRHRRVRRLPSGDAVISGGQVHGLCQEVQLFGTDVTALATHVVRLDLYVLLHAPTVEIGRRFKSRQRLDELEDRQHAAGVERYMEAAAVALELVGRPHLRVRADGSPEVVADEVASRILEHLGRR